MQNVFETLKNLKKTDFYENANLHIHTTCSDGTLEPQSVVEEAKNQNLKMISITDHNTLEAYKDIPIGKSDELTIISGIEFDCWHKSNFIHLLGYGFDINDEGIKGLCAKRPSETKLDVARFFNKRKAADVIHIIKNAGGISILAHPACCWNINLKKMIKELKILGLDGLEVYYPYVGHRGVVKFSTADRIEEIALELNLLITGGSDCHSKDLRAR